jgi:hypothetical protein
VREPDKEQNESAVRELIARYPNRWRQAVANPELRGWFVAKAMKSGAESPPMAERAAVSDAVDQFAALTLVEDAPRR